MPVKVTKTTKTSTTKKNGTPAQNQAPTTKKSAPGVGDVWNFTLDFDQVKSFEPLPAGVYRIKIAKAELGLSKQQLPKVALQYDVTGPEEYDGRKLFDNPSLEPQARFKIKNLVEALGGDTSEINTPKDLEAFLQDNEGTEFGVAVAVDGQNRNQVQRYMSAEEIPA